MRLLKKAIVTINPYDSQYAAKELICSILKQVGIKNLDNIVTVKSNIQNSALFVCYKEFSLSQNIVHEESPRKVHQSEEGLIIKEASAEQILAASNQQEPYYRALIKGSLVNHSCSSTTTCPCCSGSKECLECDGTGNVQCSYCGGNGNCYVCDGRGSVSCDNCNGYGDCPECNGSGKVPCRVCGGDGVCEECDGRGECSNCYGGGRLTCFDCDGTGLFTLRNGRKVTCKRCNGSGGIDCPDCNGSGKCSNCDGNGECPQCNGRGDFFCKACYNHNGKCWDCRGTGRVCCSECGGDGDCYNCDGSGEVTCQQCHGSGGCSNCDATGVVTCSRCKGSGVYQTYDVLKTKKECRETSVYLREPYIKIPYKDIHGIKHFDGILKKWGPERTVVEDNSKDLKKALGKDFADFSQWFQRCPKKDTSLIPWHDDLQVIEYPYAVLKYMINNKNYVILIAGWNKAVFVDNTPGWFNIIFAKVKELL